MVAIFVLTALFFMLVLVFIGLGKRQDILGNWTRYKGDPFYMATAFLYKPADDPRSRFEFMNDNFRQQMQSLVAQTFKMTMAPLFDIFQLTGGGLVGSMQGARAVQNIVATMMTSFQQIFSIFERRYEATLFRLTMTFRRLQTAMDRVWGVAASSIYKSIALTSSILSAMDLMMKIVIIILAIMVAIIIFLFLFLWPMIPVILTVIGVLVTAGMGSAVGGMADTFCFTGDTRIQMADGTVKPIHAVQLGEELLGCGAVTGRMEFLQSAELYDLHGVHVTGTHIVFHEGVPLHVKDHPAATLLSGKPLLPPVPLFCLNTDSHRIPVLTVQGPLHFADWEEIGDADQTAWNRFVFETLNPGTAWTATAAVLEGEAGFPLHTLLQTPTGPKTIGELRPGMEVADAEEGFTRVVGIVDLEEAHAGAVWRQTATGWRQGAPSALLPGRHLVTESGTFLCEGGVVRDFTDVGGHLSATYDWVLRALKTGA
jgi:hypothetical protein